MEDYVSLLCANFKDDLRESISSAANSQIDSFLASVDSYVRSLLAAESLGVRHITGNNQNASSEDVSQLTKQLSQAKSELEKAQAMICILRSALNASQAALENHLKE